MIFIDWTIDVNKLDKKESTTVSQLEPTCRKETRRFNCPTQDTTVPLNHCKYTESERDIWSKLHRGHTSCVVQFTSSSNLVWGRDRNTHFKKKRLVFYSFNRLVAFFVPHAFEAERVIRQSWRGRCRHTWSMRYRQTWSSTSRKTW